MELLSNMSWAQARKMEDEFFSLKAPWSDLEQMHKKYLGTNNLVARLSEVLSELIAERYVVHYITFPDLMLALGFLKFKMN